MPTVIADAVVETVRAAAETCNPSAAERRTCGDRLVVGPTFAALPPGPV